MSYVKKIGFLATVILSCIITMGLYRHIHIVTDIFKNTDGGIQNGVLSLQSSNRAFADLSMAERKAFVTQRCRDFKLLHGLQEQPDDTAMVFIDKEYKIVACNNHNVGSSTISGVLHSLKRNITMKSGRFRTQYLYHKIPPKTVNSFDFPSFMFVRDPLRRLLAVYHHFDTTKFTFETFLTKVTNGQDVGRHHLPYKSYYNQCRPCDVEYDYYGAMGTYGDDLRYILKQQNISIDIVPQRHALTNTREDWHTVFINLPFKIKNAVWEIYKADYYLFGYPHPADMYRRT